MLNPSLSSFSVLFVDDNTLLMDALESRLQIEPGFTGMHRAEPLSDAVPTALRVQAEIILLDINLTEGLDALEILQSLVRDAPYSHVIMYTGRPTAALVKRTMQLGARGFVSKSVSVDRLIAAIHRVRGGETVVEIGV